MSECRFDDGVCRVHHKTFGKICNLRYGVPALCNVAAESLRREIAEKDKRVDELVNKLQNILYFAKVGHEAQGEAFDTAKEGKDG